MSSTMKISLLIPSHKRLLLLCFGALFWCYFDDAYTQHAFYLSRLKTFNLKVVTANCELSVLTIILLFGIHNQTVITFQLVIWWVPQPYVLARILTRELQLFSSWWGLSARPGGSHLCRQARWQINLPARLIVQVT